jgi:hypothetical protein
VCGVVCGVYSIGLCVKVCRVRVLCVYRLGTGALGPSITGHFPILTCAAFPKHLLHLSGRGTVVILEGTPRRRKNRTAHDESLRFHNIFFNP